MIGLQCVQTYKQLTLPGLWEHNCLYTLYMYIPHECNSREIYTVSPNSCSSHTYKFTTNTTMEIFMSNKKLIFSCVKLTSRFLIALHLFGNETQMMSKCSSFHQVESTLRV